MVCTHIIQSINVKFGKEEPTYLFSTLTGNKNQLEKFLLEAAPTTAAGIP